MKDFIDSMGEARVRKVLKIFEPAAREEIGSAEGAQLMVYTAAPDHLTSVAQRGFETDFMEPYPIFSSSLSLANSLCKRSASDSAGPRRVWRVVLALVNHRAPHKSSIPFERVGADDRPIPPSNRPQASFSLAPLSGAA